MSEGEINIENILVPVDGSELSVKAAKYAIKVAKCDNARVICVHVIPAPVLVSRHVTGRVLELGSPAPAKDNPRSLANQRMPQGGRGAMPNTVQIRTLLANGKTGTKMTDFAKPEAGI